MSNDVPSGQLPDCLVGGLGDHRLSAVEWLAGGRDLRLSFQPPRAQGACEPPQVRFRLVWVSGLCIQLDFGDFGDRPLVFESSFIWTNREWSILIDFSGTPDGSIEARCNSIEADMGEQRG